MHRYHRDADTGLWNRRTGQSAVSPLDAMVVLAAGRPIFTADFYVVDGVSGEVRSWVDQSDPTHVLDQSNSARQIPLPAGHSDFGGALCGTFLDNGLYVSNRPGTAFEYCHDGTGVSSYTTFTPTEAPFTANRFIWGTIAAAGKFALLLGGNGTSAVRMEISNTAGVIYNPGAAITDEAPTYLSYHFATSQSPDVLYQQKSATVNNSDVTSPPDSGAPTGTLIMGANSGFGSLGRFRWRNLMFFPLLDGAGRSLVESYIQVDTGLAP